MLPPLLGIRWLVGQVSITLHMDPRNKWRWAENHEGGQNRTGHINLMCSFHLLSQKSDQQVDWSHRQTLDITVRRPWEIHTGWWGWGVDTVWARGRGRPGAGAVGRYWVCSGGSGVSAELLSLTAHWDQDVYLLACVWLRWCWEWESYRLGH